MSDTPITDARAFVANGSEEEKVVPLYVSRDLERQLADCRALLEAESRDSVAIAEKLFAVTEQRDRLAKALAEILSGYDVPTGIINVWEDDIEEADAALAAVNPQPPTTPAP